MPISTETISPEEIQRLMAETGMEHKLPDDFIPFAPGVQQRQGATHERPQGSQEGTAKPAQSGNSKADKSAAWKQKKARNAQKTQASSTVSAGSASVGTSSARVQRTESIRGPRIREMGPDEELEESDEDDIHQEENDDEVFPLANETIQVRPGEKIRLPKHLSRSGESEDEDGDSEEDEEVSGLWALQIFDAVIWTVPFGFLLLLLGILIKQQYALEPTFLGEVFEQSTNFPLLGVFVYFTMFSPSTSRERMVQAALFLLSIAAGSSFLYILERSMWLEVVRRTPPLGTLWIYTIVRLRLPLALVSLTLIWAFTNLTAIEAITYTLEASTTPPYR